MTTTKKKRRKKSVKKLKYSNKKLNFVHVATLAGVILILLVIILAAVPERAKRRVKTASARMSGITFSSPMMAICRSGNDVPMSAFPSLVQTASVPVEATAKLTPVMAMSAPRNLGRNWRRASCVR